MYALCNCRHTHRHRQNRQRHFRVSNNSIILSSISGMCRCSLNCVASISVSQIWNFVRLVVSGLCGNSKFEWQTVKLLLSSFRSIKIWAPSTVTLVYLFGNFMENLTFYCSDGGANYQFEKHELKQSRTHTHTRKGAGCFVASLCCVIHRVSYGRPWQNVVILLMHVIASLLI